MTPGQITLVKDSWYKAEAETLPLAELFYAKLFEIDPSLEALFLNDRLAQERKFADTLSLIVEHLGDPVTLASKVQRLGSQHVGYGVKDEHHAIVEQALLWAFKQSLGDEFTETAEWAWLLAYRTVAAAMMAVDIDEVMYPR